MEAFKEEVKLILVDDNTVFRNAIKSFLQNELKYKVIAEVSGGREFFALPNITHADIILMDLQMPEMDGYSITKELLSMYYDARIIAITMHSERAYLQELISVGFRGCVFKPDFYKNIQDAIQTVLNNSYYFPTEIKL